jgi:hypothetical protein
MDVLLKAQSTLRGLCRCSSTILATFVARRLSKGWFSRNLTQVEFYQVGISLNAVRHSQLCAPNLSMKELISKESIIKHPLLYNLIRFIIYFLPIAYVYMIFLSLHRPAKIYVKSNLRKWSIT